MNFAGGLFCCSIYELNYHIEQIDLHDGPSIYKLDISQGWVDKWKVLL